MEEDAINDLMNMGYLEPIKHMKIPHIPKNMKQPKRYVDSIEYRSRQMKKEDDIYFDNFKKDIYKVHKDKDKENRKLRFDRELHKCPSEFMKEVKDLNKQFTDFNKSIVNKKLEAIEFVTDLTPREMNHERLTSFAEWKEYNNNDKQNKLVEEIFERIELTQTNWEVDLERLNEYGRKKNTIARSLNANKDGKISTIPLRGETFHDLIE